MSNTLPIALTRLLEYISTINSVLKNCDLYDHYVFGQFKQQYLMCICLLLLSLSDGHLIWGRHVLTWRRAGGAKSGARSGARSGGGGGGSGA